MPGLAERRRLRIRMTEKQPTPCCTEEVGLAREKDIDDR
jgi:hypothetical protein